MYNFSKVAKWPICFNQRANQASRAVYSLQGNNLQQHECPLCKLCLSRHRGTAVGIFVALPLQLILVSSDNLVELLPILDEQESGHGSHIPLWCHFLQIQHNSFVTKHTNKWQSAKGGLNPQSWAGSHGKSEGKPPTIRIVLGWVAFLVHTRS